MQIVKQKLLFSLVKLSLKFIYLELFFTNLSRLWRFFVKFFHINEIRLQLKLQQQCPLTPLNLSNWKKPICALCKVEIFLNFNKLYSNGINFQCTTFLSFTHVSRIYQRPSAIQILVCLLLLILVSFVIDVIRGNSSNSSNNTLFLVYKKAQYF